MNECIVAYPSDAASYRARLLAAKAHLEKGETKEAEKLLRANLEDGYLTPKSLEWRDSLFALGSLLQTSDRDEEAIPRLEEYVERYPDSPQLIDARYLIAEAYRRSARIPREARERHDRNVADRPQQADATAPDRGDRPIRAGARHPHAPSGADRAGCFRSGDLAELLLCPRRRVLRNGPLRRRDPRYSAATNRYQHQPEVLEALMQIAACYRRLGKPEEAHGTLEQAKVILARIGKEARFTETTNYTREQWSQILDWYAGL